MLDILQEGMEDNPFCRDVPHLMRFSYIFLDYNKKITSSDIVVPSLEPFGFVVLYVFCGVCSDMLTCLFCILFVCF